MDLQPTKNICMLGHVANGKTSTVKAISGKDTKERSDEIKQNMTKRLGYANAKIFKCKICPSPKCYQPFPGDTKFTSCKICEGEMTLVDHISMVDSPGHSYLMSTMLNGTCVIDCAILVESAGNQNIPSPQTVEHLAVLDSLGIKNIIICINKIDLVTKEKLVEKYTDLKTYLTGTCAENAPIVPICANKDINIDVLCEYIVNIFPSFSKEKAEKPLKMATIRSFNVNACNVEIDHLKGGVIGGSILDGTLKINDKLCILPGIYVKNAETNEFICKPLTATVTSIHSEKNKMSVAVPGGLIGVGLTIDASLTANDRLVGNVVGHAGVFDKICNIYSKVTLSYMIMKNLSLDETTKISIDTTDNNMITVNNYAANIKCKIVSISKKTKTMVIECIDRPICGIVGDKLPISMKFNNASRLIGYGIISAK